MKLPNAERDIVPERKVTLYPKSGDENRETRGRRERKTGSTGSVTHPLGEPARFFNCFVSRLFACFAVSYSRFQVYTKSS